MIRTVGNKPVLTWQIPPTISAAQSLLTVFWLLWSTSCWNAGNPVRAGQGSPSSPPALSHDLSLGGVKHASNFCQPAQNCSACHGANLQGGSNGEPSCTKCHGDLWNRPDCGTNIHSVNLNGIYHAPNYCLPYQNCSTCHGANLRGGNYGEPSCLKCHSQKNWQNCGSIQHSTNEDGHWHAMDNRQPMQYCTPCHGSDLRGGYNQEPSCYQCHGEVWNGGAAGHTAILNGIPHRPEYCLPYQNCTSCHGTNLRGGTNGQPSCLKCHDQKKWQNCGTVQHNRSRDGVMHATGQATTVCVNCHGADLRGGYNNEPSCYKCHGKTW